MSNNLYAQALDLADQGVPVFPCWEHDKSPANENGFHGATLNPQPGPWGLVGAPTGVASGFDALDIDPRHNGHLWLEANRHRLPVTRTQTTGGGGTHFYFKAQPGVRCSQGRIAPGVDVRATGGYVIRWDACGLPVTDAPLAEWPEWLLIEMAQSNRKEPGTDHARLAAPSVAAVVELLNRLPNPLTATRDTYVRVMLGAVGAMRGLEAVGAEGTEAIADAAVAWAERWEGGAEADERAKWETDWSLRATPLAGWASLETVAGELLPGYRAEVAAAEFGAVPLPEPAPGQHPADPDAWRAMLLVNAEGNAKPCLQNAILALTHHPVWGGVISLNTFTGTLAFRQPPPWGGDAPRDARDVDLTRAAAWLQTEGIMVSRNQAEEAAIVVAHGNPWHPVRDYLAGLKWDGTPRLDGWLHTYLGAEDTPLHHAFAAKILIAAVARVQRPGCKVDTMLILEGRQGLKKSSAVAALFHGYYIDHMPDIHTKDAMQSLQGVWGMEFAELDKLARAEVSKVKAFLSTAVDRFRAPFGRLVQAYPRQCVFLGTVNPGSVGYLGDETGNRRFWTVACGVGWDSQRQVDIAGLVAARDQIWAEAAARFANGEAWWLESHVQHEQQEAAADARVTGDVWTERVAAYLADRQDASTGDVLTEALGKPAERWTRADQMRVASILRKLGWQGKQLMRNGIRERRFFPPEHVTVQAMPLAELVGD